MRRAIRSKADGDAALQKSRCIRYSLSAVAERAVARFHIILFQQILLIFREQNAVRRQKTLIQHTKLFQVLDWPHSKTLQKEIDLVRIFVHMRLQQGATLFRMTGCL